MSKLKGLKRIDRIVNDFISQFGLTASLDNEFAYYSDDFNVTYALVKTDEADQYFIPFCNHLNSNIKADAFLISFMHEIGHHFTQYNFSTDEWIRTDKIKDKIETAYGKCPKKAAKWNNSYFNLEVEKAATEWGLNYMETHAEEVAEFWAELQPAIMRFYRKNGLI